MATYIICICICADCGFGCGPDIMTAVSLPPKKFKRPHRGVQVQPKFGHFCFEMANCLEREREHIIMIFEKIIIGYWNVKISSNNFVFPSVFWRNGDNISIVTGQRGLWYNGTLSVTIIGGLK